MASDEGIKPAGKNRWTVRVKRIEARTGRKVNRKVTVEGTKTDARRARDELRADIASTQATRQRTRLKEYVASWIERRASSLKDTTVRKYGHGLAHILPAIGDIYLDAISPADVSGYLASRKAAGNTLLNELRLLRTIARDSVAEGFAPKYWCDRVKAPTVIGYTRKWPNLLNSEQSQKLMAAIPPHWLGLVLFMATTGLRWGEASALHWEDVNIKAGEAVIQYGNDKGTLTTVKTKASNRVVPVLPEVIALWGLRRRTGLVFPSRKGSLHKGTPLKKVLDKACPKAGVPRVTAHGLRRTFNNLARQGTSALVLKSITGHTTDAMMEHYSVVSTDEKTVVARNVATLIGVPKVSRKLSDE